MSVCAFQAGSEVDDGTFFHVDPGVMLAHPAPVILGIYTRVDPSGVEGPGYCSDYCQPAGKPSHGRGRGVQTSQNLLCLGIVWIMFGYQR